MKKILFEKNKWENEFNYSKSYRFDQEVSFIQENDCISNQRSAEFSDGFEYITIFSKQKYGVNTKLSTTCLFESYGAPMITLVENLDKDSRGRLRHGFYYEIVLYEEGINVWHLFMDGNECKWNKIAAIYFPVEANQKHVLNVEILDKGLKIKAKDEEFFLRIEDLPSEMHVGISACEQINRFYDFTIE